MLFKDSNSTLSDKIQLFDKSGRQIVWADEMEGCQDLEPNTGVPLELAVNLQTNLDFSSDTLINTVPDFLVPIFLMRRSVVLSDDQVHY